MLCSCPKKAALTSIKTVVCPEKFGQIQKAAFVRLTNGKGVKNGFAKSTGDITKKASWTKLIAADDDTKVVVTPYIEAPSGEAGEARTFGGGNETLGGIERIIGRNPSTFTGVFRDVPQEIIKAIKELQCEDGNLGVYLFDQYGHIEALAGAAEGDALPIPIRSFFVSDKNHGNLESPDSNNVQWAFAPNYSDNLKIFVPTDFNPLTDLVVSE